MLAWIWGTIFGGYAPDDDDDTVRVSMTDLRAITSETESLQRPVATATNALRATDKNATLFLQSIESLLMKSFDAGSASAETSPDSLQLQEMRASLEEQRATVLASLVRQREALEERLFRAQVQLVTLERQRQGAVSAAQACEDPSRRSGQVLFPAPEAPVFQLTSQSGAPRQAASASHP